MDIAQLSLFPDKPSFNKDNFESTGNQEIFILLASAVSEAFNRFIKQDITLFDTTCRSTMLNCLVVAMVEETCTSDQFHFVKSLTNTRRSLAILNDEYILLFKKYPVTNAKTKQDDLLKNQQVNRHVLILTWKVDEFWSEISRLEFQYLSSPNHVTYTYDITHLLDREDKIIRDENVQDTRPKVGLKQALKDGSKRTS